MAEGDGAVFNVFKAIVLAGEVDIAASGDTLKVMMVDSGWTPTIDGVLGYADVSADEVSGTGYTAGGITLANQAVTQDDTNNRAKFDGDDVTWSGLGADVGTPAYAILYDDTHASKRLIARWELGRPANGSDYKLQWHTDGILLLA